MEYSSRRFLAQASRTASWLTAVTLTAIFGLASSAQESPEAAAGGNETAVVESFPIPGEVESIEQLFEFVEEIASSEPEGESEQDLITHRRKIARTVVNIADKVLSLEPTDLEAMQGYYFKLQALQMLQSLGVPEAAEAFTTVIAEARADSRPDVAVIGIKFLIETGFEKWATLSLEDKGALIDAIVQYVGQSEAGVEQLQLTVTVVDFLGDMQRVDAQFSQQQRRTGAG